MRKAPASVGPNDKQFLQPGRYSRLGIGDGVGTNYSERGSTESSEHRYQKPAADIRCHAPEKA